MPKYKNASSQGNLVANIRNKFIAIAQNTHAGQDLNFSSYEFDIQALSGLKDALTPTVGSVSAVNKVTLTISAHTLIGPYDTNTQAELNNIFQALLKKAKQIDISVLHLANDDNYTCNLFQQTMRSYWENTPNRLTESFEIKSGEATIYSATTQTTNNNNSQAEQTLQANIARANQLKSRDFIQTSITNDGQVWAISPSQNPATKHFRTFLAMTASGTATAVDFSNCKLSFERLEEIKGALKGRSSLLPHLTLSFPTHLNGRKDEKDEYKDRLVNIFCLMLPKIETIAFKESTITVVSGSNNPFSFKIADLIEEAKQKIIASGQRFNTKIIINDAEVLSSQDQLPQNNNNHAEPSVSSTTQPTSVAQKNPAQTHYENQTNRLRKLLDTLEEAPQNLRSINLKDFKLALTQLQTLTNAIKKIDSVNNIDVDGMDFNYTIHVDSFEEKNSQLKLTQDVIEDFLKTILIKTKKEAKCNLESHPNITFYIHQNGNIFTEKHPIDTAQIIATVLPNTSIKKITVSPLVCNQTSISNYQIDVSNEEQIVLKLQKAPKQQKRKERTRPSSSAATDHPHVSPTNQNNMASTASIQQPTPQNENDNRAEETKKKKVKTKQFKLPRYLRKKSGGTFIESLPEYEKRMLQASKSNIRKIAEDTFHSIQSNDHDHVSISLPVIKETVVAELIQKFSTSIDSTNENNPNFKHHPTQEKQPSTSKSSSTKEASYQPIWERELLRTFIQELKKLGEQSGKEIKFTKVYDPKQTKRRLKTNRLGTFEGPNYKKIKLSSEAKECLRELAGKETSNENISLSESETTPEQFNSEITPEQSDTDQSSLRTPEVQRVAINPGPTIPHAPIDSTLSYLLERMRQSTNPSAEIESPQSINTEQSDTQQPFTPPVSVTSPFQNVALPDATIPDASIDSRLSYFLERMRQSTHTNTSSTFFSSTNPVNADTHSQPKRKSNQNDQQGTTKRFAPGK